MRLRHAALALVGLYPLAVKDVFAQTQQPTTGGTYVQGTVPYGCYLTQGTSVVFVPCTTSGASFIPSASGGGGGGGSVTQGTVPWVDTLASGTAAIGSVTVSGSVSLASGASAIGAVTQSGVWTVFTTPTTGTFASPGAIVSTGVAIALASGLYHHVQLQNLSSGATVGCSWTTSGALSGASGFQLSAGQSALWGPSTAGVPPGNLLCIASATGVPLYIETN